MHFKLNEHGELEDPYCRYCQRPILALYSINGDHEWVHNVEPKVKHPAKPHDNRSFTQHFAAEDLKDFREADIDPQDDLFL